MRWLPLLLLCCACAAELQGEHAFPVNESLVVPCPAVDAVYVYLGSGAVSAECLDDPSDTPAPEATCASLQTELTDLCTAFGGWLVLGRQAELHLWSNTWDGGGFDGLAFDWVGRSECIPNRPPELLDGTASLSVEDDVVSVVLDTPTIAGTVEANLCDPMR